MNEESDKVKRLYEECEEALEATIQGYQFNRVIELNDNLGINLNQVYPLTLELTDKPVNDRSVRLRVIDTTMLEQEVLSI